jgi:hypothetical protein
MLFLGGAAEPVFLRGAGAEGCLSAAELRRFEMELGALADRFGEARYEDRWEGVALATCQKLRCGFVAACHGVG